MVKKVAKAKKKVFQKKLEKKEILSARDKKIRKLNEEIVKQYEKDFEELAKN